MSRIFLTGVCVVSYFLGSLLCYAASPKQQSYTEILFHSDKDRVLASILQTPTGGTISGRSEYILYLSSPLNTQYIYEVSTDDELGINARRLHELIDLRLYYSCLMKFASGQCNEHTYQALKGTMNECVAHSVYEILTSPLVA